MESLNVPSDPGAVSSKPLFNRKVLIITFFGLFAAPLGWFLLRTLSGVTDPSLADHEALAESLRLAEDVRLFEGLPRQDSEPELFQAELETKSTIQVGEFPFYSTPINLASNARSKLMMLVGNVYSFRPIDRTSAKACGGFHPDYCMTWQVGPDSYYALICFTCREFKAKGKSVELHCEFGEDTYNTLITTLDSYRKNQPLH